MLAPLDVGFHATTTQSIPHDAATLITTYSEVADYGGNFNPATGVFTVPTNGFYSIDVAIEIDDLAVDKRVWSMLILNTVTPIMRGFGVSRASNHDPTAHMTISRPFSAGDTISVQVYHDGGVAKPLAVSHFSGYVVRYS